MIDESFGHDWHAEILGARPLILPPRHFTYPREAEEVERGAPEVMVRLYRQGLKPVRFWVPGVARLKSCPVTELGMRQLCPKSQDRDLGHAQMLRLRLVAVEGGQCSRPREAAATVTSDRW